MPRTGSRGGPQTRAKIAEVAGGLFLEHGFDAVTVADIAKAAGVSSVTVFKHFPRKEDLFLDRQNEAETLLVAALRAAGDPVDLLHGLTVELAEAGHPLSGLDAQSMRFFQTVAGSSALANRAREIAASLQRVVARELPPTETAPLLAAFFVAGYATVLVETAGRRLAGESLDAVAVSHRVGLQNLYDALRGGVG